MNIQDKMQEIHHKFGVTEKANYEIQLFVDDLIKKDRAEQLILSGVSIALPSRKDYDNRKLKAMYFKKDTSVGNSVLFTKGEQWQPYNWNYQRTIDYLKEGRLGYEC